MLTLTGCFAPTPLYEPNSSLDYKGKYAAYFEPGEEEIYSWYHFVITRNEKGRYIKRVFYPEARSMTSEMTYNDPSGLIANGPAKKWWDNGNLQSYGTYHQNKREGKWQYYGTNGKLGETGEYRYGKREGNWIIFDEAGYKVKEVYYKKNQMNGVFIDYDTLGNATNEGIYENNIIVKQTRTDVPERIEPYLASCKGVPDLRMKLECSQKKLSEYLLKNINYPKNSIKYQIQGITTTSFYIDKDGSVTDIEVHSGLSDDIKQECIRVISNLPKTVAGRINGKKEKMIRLLHLKFNPPVSYYDY